jgi:hypothetical protein
MNHITYARVPRRRLRPLGRSRWSLLVALVLAGASVVLTPGISRAVTGSLSGFESGDGNMVLNNLDGAHTDWNCFVGSDAFQSGTPNPNCKTTTGATHVTADVGGEIGLVSGTKFDAACPPLTLKNTPPKDDFTDIAEYSDVSTVTPTVGHTFFYGAAIRTTANGNSSGDVEFNQHASASPTTTTGCRTAGDRLVAYDYLNGGTALDFHALTWIDSTNPSAGQTAANSGKCFVKQDVMPCWGATVVTPTATTFDGLANPSAITAADNGISGTALVVNQFAEFGIDLTQALNLGPCVSFPQQVWESRSSGSSFTSNPEDVEIASRTVGQPCATTITTSINGNGTTSVPVGTSVYDTATLTGVAKATAGGTVTYTVYTENTCTTAASVQPSPATVTVTNGIVPNSGTVTLNPGSYFFQAVYSGDANNAGSTSVCTSEPLTVLRAPPTASTTQSLVPNDTFTLSGAFNPTGSVTFTLYGPSNTSCSGSTGVVFTQIVSLTGSSASTTNSLAVSAPGTYSWLDQYPGDGNNEAVNSSCTETFTIS